MSLSALHRIMEIERKHMELEARIWQLEKLLEKAQEARKPGRPKSERAGNPSSH